MSEFLVLMATRPQTDQAVRAIYAFEVPSSTEWAFDQFSLFQPNVFVDISLTLETKIEAMAVYESEARPFPHPRSPEALRALARWRWSTAGLEAAGGLEVVRDVCKWGNEFAKPIASHGCRMYESEGLSAMLSMGRR